MRYDRNYKLMQWDTKLSMAFSIYYKYLLKQFFGEEFTISSTNQSVGILVSFHVWHAVSNKNWTA